jgi:membrane protein required for beta-lactamase induction
MGQGQSAAAAAAKNEEQYGFDDGQHHILDLLFLDLARRSAGRLLSAVCGLLSALCSLLSALCSLLTAHCSLLSTVSTPS